MTFIHTKKFSTSTKRKRKKNRKNNNKNRFIWQLDAMDRCNGHGYSPNSLMSESAGKSANLALKFVCRFEMSSSHVGRPRACWRSVTLSLHEYLMSLRKTEL